MTKLKWDSNNKTHTYVGLITDLTEKQVLSSGWSLLLFPLSTLLICMPSCYLLLLFTWCIHLVQGLLASVLHSHIWHFQRNSSVVHIKYMSVLTYLYFHQFIFPCSVSTFRPIPLPLNYYTSKTRLSPLVLRPVISQPLTDVSLEELYLFIHRKGRGVKPVPSATLSTKDPTLTTLGLNLTLYGTKPTTYWQDWAVAWLQQWECLMSQLLNLNLPVHFLIPNRTVTYTVHNLYQTTFNNKLEYTDHNISLVAWKCVVWISDRVPFWIVLFFLSTTSSRYATTNGSHPL
jgi:hypothetical protein